MPIVSIIIPVYNVEKYLDRCVTSVLNQTLNDIEIILVDDQSPDKCPLLCDNYSKKYKNIKVIHKKNAGLGMACNSGLEIACGEYVAFLDSDDWVDPDMYNTLYTTAKKYDAQMVFSGLRRIDENGVSTPMDQAPELRIHTTSEQINAFALGMIASFPTIRKERQVQMSAKVVLYERKHLIDNNIKFESERILISEDLFFNLDNIIKAKTIVEIPQTFYNYFVNSQSLSNTIRLDRFEKIVFLHSELIKRYSTHITGIKTRANRLFIGESRNAIRQICKARNKTFTEKISLVHNVINHPLWDCIKNDYPIDSMPVIHRIFLKNILNRNALLLFFLSKIKG